MQCTKSTLALGLVKGAVVAAVLLFAMSALAKTKPTAVSYTGQVLYSFGDNYPDGSTPYFDGMVMDKAGNIYGSVTAGGLFSYGMIFELTNNGGFWNETDIHDFDPNSTSGPDGNGPQGALAIDSEGNLYGTTVEGGTGPCTEPGNPIPVGCGVVFKLSPPPAGSTTWTETTLYSFGANKKDGITPSSGVTLGNAAGTILYGTTVCGGNGRSGSGTDGINTCSAGAGTVWEVAYSKATAKWSERIIHNFPGLIGGPDGWQPQAGLLLNGGNLYGITSNGGKVAGRKFSDGIVFELKPGSSGWTESILYTFGANANGAANQTGGTHQIPAMDSNHNIYGTSAFGGTSSFGTAWELVYSPTTDTYSEQVLYSFSGDAETPNWGLVYSKGSWFGTTGGWDSFTDGSVFKLTYSAKTGWTETDIYTNFVYGYNSSIVDDPGWNQLIADQNGNLYGMGEYGGDDNDGGVFEISPIP